MQSAGVRQLANVLEPFVSGVEEADWFEFGDGLFGALAIVIGGRGVELLVAESFVARHLAHPGQVGNIGE